MKIIIRFLLFSIISWGVRDVNRKYEIFLPKEIYNTISTLDMMETNNFMPNLVVYFPCIQTRIISDAWQSLH